MDDPAARGRGEVTVAAAFSVSSFCSFIPYLIFSRPRKLFAAQLLLRSFRTAFLRSSTCISLISVLLRAHCLAFSYFVACSLLPLARELALFCRQLNANCPTGAEACAERQEGAARSTLIQIFGRLLILCLCLLCLHMCCRLLVVAECLF